MTNQQNMLKKFRDLQLTCFLDACKYLLFNRDHENTNKKILKYYRNSNAVINTIQEVVNKT